MPTTFFQKFYSLLLLSSLLGQWGMTQATPSEELFLGRNLWLQGYYDSAFGYFQAGLEAARMEQDSARMIEGLHLCGKYLTRHGRLEEGADHLDEAIQLGRSVDVFHPDFLLAQCERAYLESLKGRYQYQVEELKRIQGSLKGLPAGRDSVRAMVIHRLSNAWLLMGEIDSGMVYCQQALDLRKRILPPDHLTIAYSENTLGNLYSWYGEYETSLHHYERAEQILGKKLRPNHTQVIQIRTNIAVLFEELGLYWESLERLRENLPYLEQINPEARFSLLFNYSSNLMVVGDAEEALAYLAETERVIRAYPGINPEAMALVQGERSGVYEDLGQLEEALRWNQAALQSYRSLPETEPYRLVIALSRKGAILTRMNRHRAAIDAFEEALAIGQSRLPENSAELGWCWEFRAEALLAIEKPEEAFESLSQAGRLYLARDMGWNMVDVYRKQAKTWESREQPDSCFHYYRLGWESALPDVPYRQLPDAALYPHWDQFGLDELLLDQAESLLHFSDSEASLRAAWANLTAALAIRDSQALYVQSSESRLDKKRQNLPLVERLLVVSVRYVAATQDSSVLYEALRRVELSKASQLLEHVLHREAMHFAGVPDSLVAQERYYRQRLRHLHHQKDQEAEDGSEADFELRQQYRTWLAQLRQTYPRYFQATHVPQAWQPAEAQKLLQAGQVCYSYFWGEQLYVFRLTSDGLSLIQRELPDQLEEWQQFISQPPSSHSEEWLEKGQIGHQLTQHLLPVSSGDPTSVLVIPHGPLGYLPFQSLPASLPESPDLRNWRFMGEQFPWVYTNSLLFWQQIQTSPPTKEWEYVGFAPDFSSSHKELLPLLHNEAEVRQAAQRLGGSMLLGKQASEQRFKSLGESAHLIHLATHAVAEPEAHWNSRLFFAESEKGEEDGILYEEELYSLRLQSPLTILSACQTASGPLQFGQGLASLAQAFQYAGSERIIASLWKVDDQATAQLNGRMFAHLEKNTEVETAVFLARKAYLGEADTYHAHPYFWAGHILIGKGGPLTRPSMDLKWLLGIGGVFLILIFLFRKQWNNREINRNGNF